MFAAGTAPAGWPTSTACRCRTARRGRRRAQEHEFRWHHRLWRVAGHHHAAARGDQVGISVSPNTTATDCWAASPDRRSLSARIARKARVDRTGTRGSRGAVASRTSTCSSSWARTRSGGTFDFVTGRRCWPGTICGLAWRRQSSATSGWHRRSRRLAHVRAKSGIAHSGQLGGRRAVRQRTARAKRHVGAGRCKRWLGAPEAWPPLPVQLSQLAVGAGRRTDRLASRPIIEMPDMLYRAFFIHLLAFW